MLVNAFFLPRSSSISPRSPFTPLAARDGGATGHPTPYVGRDAGVTSGPATPRGRLTRSTAWRGWELKLLAVLPLPQDRAALVEALRKALVLRAGVPTPPTPRTEAEARAVERVRFGLLGEQLCSRSLDDLLALLRQELKEVLWTLETEPLRLVRNWKLAMHRARLAQLLWELGRRPGVNLLEEMGAGLGLRQK